MKNFMHTRISLLSVLFSFFFLFAACESEESVNVNQDKIYTEYRLVYESNQDKSFARSTFRFGSPTGTQLELSSPASVSVEGDPLTWRPLLAYYDKSYAGVIDTKTFSYTDLDDNTFVNTVEMAKPIDFPASLTEISKSSAFAFSWDGEPLESGESVIVTVNGTNEGGLQIFTINELGATEIILAANQLSKVATGSAKLLMERWSNQTLVQGTGEGGAVWSRYIATPIDVTITN